MSKFSHVKKQLSFSGENTARFPFYELEGDPVPTLIVKPALESNKPYFNAILRKNRNNSPTKQKMVNAHDVTEARNADRELYAQFVVVDWENIMDTKGNPVPFSQEDALEFLNAIPDPMFDQLRFFATDFSKFIDNQLDAEEVGKN